jgi:hypothetical protein
MVRHVGVHAMVWDPEILTGGDPRDWFQNGLPVDMANRRSQRIEKFLDSMETAWPTSTSSEKGGMEERFWSQLQNDGCLVLLEVESARAQVVLERVRVLANFFDLKVYEPAPTTLELGKARGRSVFVQRLLWMTALAMATAYIVLKLIR